MASGSRGGDAPVRDDVPKEMANVTPPQTPMVDHSFTLQAIMDVQKSVVALTTKVERLIEDVGDHGKTLTDMRERLTRVEERVGHLPRKGFIVAALISALTICSAIVTVGPKLQTWINSPATSAQQSQPPAPKL